MMGLDICATCGHRKDQHKPACVAFAPFTGPCRCAAYKPPLGHNNGPAMSEQRFTVRLDDSVQYTVTAFNLAGQFVHMWDDEAPESWMIHTRWTINGDTYDISGTRRKTSRTIYVKVAA